MDQRPLPDVFPGFEIAPKDETLTDKHLWGYPGATCWLPTSYAGEPQPKNNVYIRPAEKEQA